MECRGNSVVQLSQRIGTVRLNHGGRHVGGSGKQWKDVDFVRTGYAMGDVPLPTRIRDVDTPSLAHTGSDSNTETGLSVGSSSRFVNEFNAKVHKAVGKRVNANIPRCTVNYTMNHMPVNHMPVIPRSTTGIDWASEFAKMEQELLEAEVRTETGESSTIGYHYSSDMEEDCQNIYEYTSGSEAPTATESVGKYQFHKENKYLHRTPGAYDIACILMENNCNLSEVALAFEAAIQEQDQQHLIDSWYRLGLVQLQNERENKAIEALHQVLALDVGHVEAMKLLAVSYVNEGDKPRAIRTVTALLKSKGIQCEPFREELNILNTRDILEHILGYIPSPLTKYDKDLLTAQALLNYLLNRPEISIECFEKILERDPSDENIWNHLGATMANSSRNESAIQTYLKTIELKPSFVRARYNLGNTLVKVGDSHKGIESLLIALTMQGTKIDVGFQTLPEFIETLRKVELEANNTIIKSLRKALLEIPPDADTTEIETKIMMILDLNLV